jgi:protein-S-isoprenylcysteine O-methyltransferase Ste14
MGLDIRWPIGLMFSLIGVILVVAGLVTSSNTELYHRSLDINVNLYWGLVLLVFGGTMLVLAWRGSAKPPEAQSPPQKPADQVASRH